MPTKKTLETKVVVLRAEVTHLQATVTTLREELRILRDKFDNFVFFPKLPLELRLEIWRLTFPGSRKVCVDAGLFWDESGGFPDERAALPITLRINHESRTETLRHYHDMLAPFPHPSKANTIVTPPTRGNYINFERDIAYLHVKVEPVFSSLSSDFKVYRRRYRDLMSNVKILEIQGRRSYFTELGQLVRSTGRRMNHDLKFFTSLDELRLVGAIVGHQVNIAHFKRKEPALVQWFESAIEKLHEKNANFSIPKVTIETIRMSQAGFREFYSGVFFEIEL